MKTLKILLVLVFIYGLNLYAQNDDKKSLTLGFMPYLSSDVLIKKYTPLAKYLSKKLNKDVKIVVAKNYNQHLENTGKDKLDISFLGGSPYVVIGDKYGKKPLLVRYEFSHKPTFNSVIFVNENSKLKNLKDLKEKSIAFGSAKSTLSTQVPLYMLMQEGISLEDLSYFKHLRNHENVIYGVLYGDFDAGAVAIEVFNENKSKGIKALAYSKELSTHVFVTRANLDKKLQEKIKDAFLQLKDEKVLKSISPSLTAFVDVKDEDYDYHRVILKDVLPVLEK